MDDYDVFEYMIFKDDGKNKPEMIKDRTTMIAEDEDVVRIEAVRSVDSTVPSDHIVVLVRPFE